MTAELEIADALRVALRADEVHLVRLHDRLAAEAAAAGLLDVAYRTVETPVGTLLLAATDAGLVRVAYPCEDHGRVLEDLAGRIGTRVLRHLAPLDDAARQLDEYFDGQRQTFELALDWRLASGFRSTVLHLLPAIDYGQTASYATVARMSGRPTAARAVGMACAANPMPVVVPCHRVIRSNGAMGGYLGGVDAKATLLALEHAA